MRQVEWSNDLSVGIELIDEQHKMLIQHLNNFTAAVDNREGPVKTADTLGFLIKYTDFHFSTEEDNMARNEYSGLEEHRARHNEFKSSLRGLEQDFKEEGPTHDLAESIDRLLVNWLIKHIRVVDVGFGSFLKENNITITASA